MFLYYRWPEQQHLENNSEKENTDFCYSQFHYTRVRSLARWLDQWQFFKRILVKKDYKAIIIEKNTFLTINLNVQTKIPTTPHFYNSSKNFDIVIAQSQGPNCHDLAKKLLNINSNVWCLIMSKIERNNKPKNCILN